jgi:hypothetical protein
VAAIRAYGAEATKALASLPEKNPAAFKQLIDTHYPGLETRRDANGRTLVLLDGEDNWTTWATAVMLKEVKF